MHELSFVNLQHMFQSHYLFRLQTSWCTYVLLIFPNNSIRPQSAQVGNIRASRKGAYWGEVRKWGQGGRFLKTTTCAIPQIQRRAKNHTKVQNVQRRKEWRKRRFLRKGVIESDLGFGKTMLAVSKEWIYRERDLQTGSRPRRLQSLIRQEVP